ncbi:MAG: ABC transporter ATP-binding protein/permease [Clostridiales bacterium]|nr:ABC transporter ATP-binding protein/permease [Clostridiales bacterium]
MLEVKHLKKEYRTKKGTVTKALDDVSLNFPETGMVFILGKSGSGKSTLLNVCGGLDRMDSGEIIIKGKSSSDFSAQDFDSYRNTYVGFVFQEYNILDEFTVEQNIALALELQNKKPDKEVIDKILGDVDLADYASRKPNTLSGGQKQRVAIARALVKEPEIIMADEPTGALDSKTGQQVFDTLKKLSKEKLVLVISHDRDFAEQYGDRIIELKDGKVISDQTRSEDSGAQNVKFYGTDTVCVNSGAALTDADMASIKNFLARSGGTAVISTSREKIAQFKEDRPEISAGTFENIKQQPQPKEYEPQKLIRSHLPVKHAIKMGAGSLKTKPVRLMFTILLSIVAFILFGLASTLMLFDGNSVTKSTLNEVGDKYIVFSKAYYETYRSYEGGKLNYEDVNKRETSFTFEEFEELKKKYPGAIAALDVNINIDNSVKINQAAEQFYSTYLDGVLIADDSLTYLNGEAPKEDDEVAISDFILSMIMLQSTEFYYYPDALTDTHQEGVKLAVTKADDIIFDEENPRYMFVEGGYYKVTGVYKGDDIPSEYQVLKSAADQGNPYSGDRSDEYYWRDVREDGMYNKLAVTAGLAKKMAQIASSNNSYFDSSKYFKYSQSDVRVGTTVENGEFKGYSNNYLGKYDKDGGEVLKLYDFDGKEVTSLGSNQVAMRYSDVAQMLYNIYRSYSDSVPSDFWDNMNNAIYDAHNDYYANHPYPQKNSGSWFNNKEYDEYWNPAYDVINAAYNAAYEEYAEEHPAPDSRDYSDDDEFNTAYQIWSNNRSNYANKERDKAEKEYRATHPGGDIDEYVDFDAYVVVYRAWQNGYEDAQDQARIDAAGKLKPYYELMFRMKQAAREAFDEANPEPKHVDSEEWSEWNNMRSNALGNIDPINMLNYLSYDNGNYEAEEVFEILNTAFDMLEEMNALDKIVVHSGFDNSESTVEIAGVYFDGSYNSGIYLSEELYDKLFVSNGNDYYYTTESKYEAPEDAYISAIYIPKTDSSVVNALVDMTYLRGTDDSSYMILNAVMGTLDMAIELVDTLSLAFLIAGLALALFAFLLMFNFISASITAKKKDIGILRAIGARTTDVFKIFVSEALIIALICFAISTLGTFGLCILLNGMLLDSSIQINMFVFGPISVLAIFGIALVTALVSTLIPVGIYSRKPPIASIRAL